MYELGCVWCLLLECQTVAMRVLSCMHLAGSTCCRKQLFRCVSPVCLAVVSGVRLSAKAVAWFSELAITLGYGQLGWTWHKEHMVAAGK